MAAVLTRKEYSFPHINNIIILLFVNTLLVLPLQYGNIFEISEIYAIVCVKKYAEQLQHVRNHDKARPQA